MKKFTWLEGGDEDDAMMETNDETFPDRQRWVRWSDVGPVYDAAMAYERMWKAVYEDGTEEPRELLLAAENLVYVCRRAKEGA